MLWPHPELSIRLLSTGLTISVLDHWWVYICAGNSQPFQGTEAQVPYSSVCYPSHPFFSVALVSLLLSLGQGLMSH